MHINFLSDLHLDLDDKPEKFLRSIDRVPSDVLVIAGDVANGLEGVRYLEKLCEIFFNLPIVYVCGNHEYYGLPRDHLLQELQALTSRYENLHFLNRETVEIKGQRFVGTTLWYPRPSSEAWSDFHEISAFRDWYEEEAKLDEEFLLDNLRKNDILVTHMLPSWKCVAPRWREAKSNQFFVHNVEPIIADRKPSYAFFGHTHESIDVILDGGTRAISNPRGHDFKWPNGFELDCILDTETGLISRTCPYCKTRDDHSEKCIVTQYKLHHLVLENDDEEDVS